MVTPTRRCAVSVVVPDTGLGAIGWNMLPSGTMIRTAQSSLR
jgi:hypothetical protein